MNRRTKIVATLGPATDGDEVMNELVSADINGARINFSHGAEEDHLIRARAVRDVAEKLGRHVALIVDLAGPRTRIAGFENGTAELAEGRDFTLDSSHPRHFGTSSIVGLQIESLIDVVSAGDVLTIDDGLIELRVKSIEGPAIHCKITKGGELASYKGISRRGGGLPGGLTEKDRSDISLASHMEADFVIVSSVQDSSAISEARQLLADAKSHANVIAKIERLEAVENIDDIVHTADGILIEPGSLVAELGVAAFVPLQRKLIEKARGRSKLVVGATTGIRSMTADGSPTTPAVSDIANLVLDGIDAILLSEETAVGVNPAEVVRVTGTACEGAEMHASSFGWRSRISDKFKTFDEGIAMSTMYLANHVSVNSIISICLAEKSTISMSRIRSDIPIHFLTSSAPSCRRANLYRGVSPIHWGSLDVADPHVVRNSLSTLLSRKVIQLGDLVLVTRSTSSNQPNTVNALEMHVAS